VTIARFGTGTNTYAFYNVTAWSDNFGNYVPNVSRLMGVSGGVSQYGSRPAPREVGSVSVTTMLTAATPRDMQTQLDNIRKMGSWGVQDLWLIPDDPTLPPRFCLASTNGIPVAHNAENFTETMISVTLTFQVADPRWLSYPGTVWYWDDGTLWDAKNWVEPRSTSTTINASSTVSLTNNGNTPTPLVIRVTATANVSNFEMTLLDNTGAIINGFRYENTLASATADVLTVDSETLSVLHDQTTGAGIASGYPYFTRLGGNGFIILPPGTWTLDVNGTFTSNVTLDIEYYDAWS
jgi:hypothetical protein